MKTGKCFICGNECENDRYAHFECSVAYMDAKNNRIRVLMEKYGTGLRFEQILIKESDL